MKYIFIQTIIFAPFKLLSFLGLLQHSNKFMIYLLAVIFYLVIPIASIWAWRFLRNLFQRHKYRLHELIIRGYIQKKKAHITNGELAAKYDWPKVTDFPDKIIIDPISSQKTTRDAINDLEFFSEHFRTKIASLKKEQRGWWVWKRDCLVLFRENIPDLLDINSVTAPSFSSVVIGGNKQKIKSWDVSEENGALVVGAQGSGKSTLLLAICLQFLKKLFKVKVTVATYKDPEEDYGALVGKADLISFSSDEGYQKLSRKIHEAIADIERIKELHSAHNVNKWHLVPEALRELEVIVIDEAFALSTHPNWKVDAKILMKLISIGRSYGKIVILGTQGQDAGEFKDIGIDPGRFAIKIGSRTRTPQLSSSLYGNEELGMDPTLHKGKMIFVKGSDVEVIRAVSSQNKVPLQNTHAKSHRGKD